MYLYYMGFGKVAEDEVQHGGNFSSEHISKRQVVSLNI